MTQLSDNNLFNDVNQTFLEGPHDAEAFGLTLDGEICWYKDITPNSFQFIYSSHVREGELIEWSVCTSGRIGHEPLVYRPFDVVESPEERECFERLEREQQINAMAAIARKCPTTSSTGIAAVLFDAGCRIELLNVQI
jgi:(2Fe-2S) ferredoxin